MKIKLPTKQFAALLNAFSKIIKPSTTHPQLGNIIIECVPQKLKLSGFDPTIERTMSVQTECETGDTGSITLNFARLKTFVSCCGEPECLLSTDGNNAVVKIGRSVMKIQGLPLEDMPKWPEPNGEAQKLNIPAPLFNECVSKSLVQTGTVSQIGGQHAYLSSVMLVGHDGMLNIQASNKRRLIICETPVPFFGDEQFIIPKDSASAMTGIAESGELEILASTNVLTIKSESVTFSTKLIEQISPSFRQVFPPEDKLKMKIVAKREEFISEITKAASVNTIDVPSVLIECDGKQISIDATGQDAAGKAQVANVRTELDALEGSDVISFACNPQYLIDALKSFDEEEITIRFRDAVSAFVIRNDNTICSISPQRPTP